MIVWTTLITNTNYLSGLLTLDYCLKKHGSKYPLIALYTDTFPESGHKALDARGIPKQYISYLLPSVEKDYSADPRFYDCWSKLAPFSLTDFDRVVQLDSDMLPLKNMDELMDIPLDPPSLEGKGNRVFAAAHACVCNPRKKAHYPKDWVPENCAFTTMHDKPDLAQTEGPSNLSSFGMPNGGLQVINPSKAIFDTILRQLTVEDAIQSYAFADQSMLSDLFHGRWVPIPYRYNALKTLRDCHAPIWRDDEVSNVHYILSPKPWDESPDAPSEETHKWWHTNNQERLTNEKAQGLVDGF